MDKDAPKGIACLKINVSNNIPKITEVFITEVPLYRENCEVPDKIIALKLNITFSLQLLIIGKNQLQRT